MRVKVLSLEPLTAVPPLHVTDRDIVRAGVAEDVAHRGSFADVAAALSNDDGELGLPVQLLRVGRGEQHRCIRSDDGRRVLREERRVIWYLLRRELRAGLPTGLFALLEMLAVVPADAEDVARRTRDRRLKLRGREWDTASSLARGRAKLRPELLAREQQVEHVVLVGRTAHEVDGRDDRVVRADDTRRRHAALLEGAEPQARGPSRPAEPAAPRASWRTRACNT